MECYFIHEIVDLIFSVLLFMWYYYNKRIGKNIRIALIAGLVFILTSLFYTLLPGYIIGALELFGSILFFILFAKFFRETLEDENVAVRATGVLIIAFTVFLLAYMKGVYRAYNLTRVVFLTWVGFRLFKDFGRIRVGDRAVLFFMIVFSALSGVFRILGLLVLSDFLYFGAEFFLLLSIVEKMYTSLPRHSNFFKR